MNEITAADILKWQNVMIESKKENGERFVDSTEEEFLKTKKMLAKSKLSRRLPNWSMKLWWTRTIS